MSGIPTIARSKVRAKGIAMRGGVLAALALVAFATDAALAQPGPRMNQIQVIGTHNSYHLRKSDKPFSKEWDYEHAPLDDQLALGVRSFELDLNLRADGWHVFHVPKLDDASSCPLLRECLESVKRWSDAHPRHVPISFLCEVKQEGRQLDPSILDFDAAAADRLDSEIRAVFGEDRLLTPDHVRRDAATLEEAVLTKGWPSLEAARGRVFFILHEEGDYRDVYTAGRPSLEGRAMFVRSDPGRPDAATLVEDSPKVERIRAFVARGYYVRTRADGTGGPSTMDGRPRARNALDSGAQIVSTDFPPGEPHESGYMLQLPGGVPARCNPANAPPTCREPLE